MFRLFVDAKDFDKYGKIGDLTIDFQYINPGNDFFEIFYAGEFIGFYELSDLPVTLENFEDNGEDTPVLAVCINDVMNCCAEAEYDAPCNSGGGDCEIWDLNVEVGDCNPDGTYHLWINFEYQNTSQDFFDVIYNGEIVGFFALSELPVHIENFEDDGDLEQGILVCINDSNCCEDVGFESPQCGGSGSDCEIWDVFAEAHECDDEGNFMVDIEFNSNNTGGEGFSIVANDFEFGPFEYGETFYTFGPLESGVIYEILVLDNQFSDCGGHYVLGPIYCDDNCHIYDLHAEVTECDDEGQFYVILDFEYSNIGNDGFKVVGNGNVYGFFGYDELPIELGPFEAPVDGLEFLVTDVQHPDCGDFVEIDGVDCEGGGDCEIFDLTADITPCTDDGTFYVVLDFEHENTSEIAFSVNGNGISYGFYGYDDLPISIGPLIGNGTTPYEFAVQDILFEDCGAAIGVGPVDCNISGDCQITNFVVDPSACNDDGTYNLWLNFSYQNATNLYFDVIFNGEIIAYFPLAELPVIIPHFPENDIGVQEITVCINDTPDCCATTEYEAPDCLGPNLVWPGDAEANNEANHFDLLNIGLAFGAEGPERDVQGIEWTDLLAEQWSQSFTTGLNFAHADCNGDGVVDKEDIEAVHLNFGESHGEVEEPILIGGSEIDPPFYVDLLGAAPIIDGEQFSASIMLGNEDFPVDDLYGVAFTMNFDPAMIDPASIELKYDPSWLGVENVNLISFDRVMMDAGQVHVSLVRTDKNNVSGHGHVAEIIGIIDNIAGKEEVKIEISDVKGITAAEVLVPFTRPVQIAGLVSNTHESVQGIFEVYPNPARTEVKLQHPLGLSVESVRVENVNGQAFEVDFAGNNVLNVSQLPEGVFFLTIETKEGVFIEKLVKM